VRGLVGAVTKGGRPKRLVVPRPHCTKGSQGRGPERRVGGTCKGGIPCHPVGKGEEGSVGLLIPKKFPKT